MYSETLTAARSLLLSDILTDIYIVRFIKPFDDNYFITLCSKYDIVEFIEDGVKTGGISEYMDSLLKNNESTSRIITKIKAFPDCFVSNGTRESILKSVGLSAEEIASDIKNLSK